MRLLQPKIPEDIQQHVKNDKNKIKNFKNLFLIVQQFYNLKSLSLTCFNQLTKTEEKLLFYLLKKLYPSKFNTDKITFIQLQQLKKISSKKRNEEKIKQIWKRFLRKIYDDFKIQKNDIKETDSDKKPTDKWKEFYIYMFQDLINKEIYNLDLVMDICTEKTIGLVNSSKKKNLTSLKNWKCLNKISAMKKIPASFRYLVSKSPKYLKIFEDYLNVNNSKGIVMLMKKIIKNKLYNLFCQWETKFTELNCDHTKFLSQVQIQIKKKKFKLPWLLSNVKNSIDYCLLDIRHHKLAKKFESIRKNHYSFNSI